MTKSNENIERKIIGSLMLIEDQLLLNLKLSRLQPKYFQLSKYKMLFEDIKRLNSEHIVPEIINITEYFPDKYDEIDLLDIQGQAQVAELLDTYMTQLKDIWAKNEIDKIFVSARIHNQNSLNVFKTAEEHISKIKEIQAEIKRTENATQDELRNNIKKKFEAAPDKQMLVPYFLPKVHEKIEIFRGQLHFIGSESGIGKTALGLACIQHQYAHGVNTVFFCCESKAEELLIRLACQRSVTSYSNAVKGFKYGGKEAFLRAMDYLNQYPESLQLYGRDNYRHTIENIDYTLWEIQKKTRIDMVYVDYFQTLRMENESKFKKQYQVYEDILLYLSDLSVKYNCAITVFSQFNREREESGMPGLMNFKGSSAIENVAHIISIIHQKKEDKKDVKLRIKPTILSSVKTRLIAPFNLRLAYDAYCGMFYDSLEPVPFPWDIKIGA